MSKKDCKEGTHYIEEWNHEPTEWDMDYEESPLLEFSYLDHMKKEQVKEQKNAKWENR